MRNLFPALGALLALGILMAAPFAGLAEAQPTVVGASPDESTLTTQIQPSDMWTLIKSSKGPSAYSYMEAITAPSADQVIPGGDPTIIRYTIGDEDYKLRISRTIIRIPIVALPNDASQIVLDHYMLDRYYGQGYSDFPSQRALVIQRPVDASSVAGDVNALFYNDALWTGTLARTNFDSMGGYHQWTHTTFSAEGLAYIEQQKAAGAEYITLMVRVDMDVEHYTPIQAKNHLTIDLGDSAPTLHATGIWYSEYYNVNMLAGDPFALQLTAPVPCTYAVTSGSLATVGLSLHSDTVSGTAATGKQTVIVTATSIEGPTQYWHYVLTFRVYSILTLTGSIPPSSWAGQPYSATLTTSDVNPDAAGEVSLALNAPAISAGYTLTRNSETSWTLARSAVANVPGTVPITVTATTAAGGISQSKFMTMTVAVSSNVAITSVPTGHQGAGTAVWLVEGDDTWTYKPTVVPGTAVVTVTGLSGGMTWSNGILSVPCTVPMPETTVTITATSSIGGSPETATQILKIRVFEYQDPATVPSVSQILTVIDGRTVTASVTAENYSTIVWEMGDGTTYEDVTEVSHTYVSSVGYTIRVTVTDDMGKSASAVANVPGSEPGPSPGTEEPPLITSTPPTEAVEGELYSYLLTADKAVSWTYVSGPDWLTLVGNNLSGVPPSAGVATISISAAADGLTVHQNWTVTVTAAAPIGGDDDDNITAGIADFADKYAWLIVGAAGVVGLVAYAVAVRHPVVLIVGIGLLVVAALLKFGGI
mgnify:CR=1 FL=1|jgi:hypothetical protein